MTGTALFLVSDLTLGVNKFVLNDRQPRLGGVVMATYTAGQGLIAIGVAKAATAQATGADLPEESRPCSFSSPARGRIEPTAS